jgi:cytochrome c peroxidase
MKKLTLFLLVLLPILWSCNQNTQKNTATSEDNAAGTDELMTKATAVFKVLPAMAVNPENPITDEKVTLGHALYFDTRLSNDDVISCNSCHNLDTYGVDNLPTSPGDKGEFGGRNSPTVLNAALHMTQFWDGRAKDVEEQAGGPILNSVEMAMPDAKVVIERLSKVPGYKAMFAAAFPDDPDPIKYENLQKAIGAYERMLMTPSNFDTYLAGDATALTAEEKHGMETFMNSGCTACHSGVVMGGNMYQKFGLFGNYWDFTQSKKEDEGRYEVTKNEADKFVFKVPSLRNVDKTYPYFHDGSVADLSEAVKIIAKTQLNKDLTDEEVAQIVVFLKSMTGKVPPELAKKPEMPV